MTTARIEKGLDRRSFLRKTAAGAGGLLIGFYLPSRSRLKADTAEAKLNAFVHVSADDYVTLFIHKAEMGQGTVTSLSMLLAEELEIELSRVKVVAAPVGDPYVNVLNGGQVTGTSNSVQDAWEKLRKAGAQARMMLIAAAAQRWHVKPSDCQAHDGRVNSAQGKTASYGELAEAASKLPVP